MPDDSLGILREIPSADGGGPRSAPAQRRARAPLPPAPIIVSPIARPQCKLRWWPLSLLSSAAPAPEPAPPPMVAAPELVACAHCATLHPGPFGRCDSCGAPIMAPR